MYRLFTIISMFCLENSWARSIKATADRLGSEAKNIGLSVAILGLAIAGMMLALGKQDASNKITQAFLGGLVIVMSTSIVGFIKGVA